MVASGALLQQDAAARSSFDVLIHSAPFGVMPAIPHDLPSIFMVWAEDDTVARVPVTRFYDALMSAGLKPEAHVFSTAGYGFYMRKPMTMNDWIVSSMTSYASAIARF